MGDYALDTFKAKGAGRSNNPDLSNYSKFGVQVNALFKPDLIGQIQVITDYNYDNTFQPEVEWYNLQYVVNSELALRVGRVELPTFIDSGNHDVGYSYVWAHLPIETYHLLSIQTSDGMDATLTSKIGDAKNSLKFLYGQNITDRPTSITNSKNMFGIFDRFEYNQITLYFGYQMRISSVESKATGLSNGWNPSSDLTLGVNYDPGDWFITSEWIRSQTRYKSNAYYASVGYRFNKIIPYLSHSQSTAGSFSVDAVPSASSVLRSNRSQKTDSLGVRWDFMKNYAFKFQCDRVTLSNNSNGFLINVPSNVTLYGDTFYAFSAVVDFIF
jgi:hypothetical protein